MIFGKTKLEFKVGVFVFCALIVLAFFILSIGKFKTLTAGYLFDCVFNFVNGIKVGAPVRYAGVDVGEVKRIDLVLDPATATTKVKVVCWVRNDIHMPADSSFWVNTLGLFGEKYIEIIPGKNYATTIQPGATVTGNEPIAMHEVTEIAKNIANDIEEIIVKIKNKEGTIGKLLSEDIIYKELEALVIDIRKNPWKLFWKSKEKK